MCQGDWPRKCVSVPLFSQYTHEPNVFWVTTSDSCCINYQPSSQGFWYFARSRSREFQVNPWNPAKFTKTHEIPRNSVEILPNTCRHNIFESYLGYWGCLLAVNLLIYLETSSPQRVNNTPKIPGVLRLMLRKTGKQWCKIPGVPSVDGGNWRWECDSLFYCVLAPREECCVLWRITPYTFTDLSHKDVDLFRNGSVHEW